MEDKNKINILLVTITKGKRNQLLETFNIELNNTRNFKTNWFGYTMMIIGLLIFSVPMIIGVIIDPNASDTYGFGRLIISNVFIGIGYIIYCYNSSNKAKIIISEYIQEFEKHNIPISQIIEFAIENNVKSRSIPFSEYKKTRFDYCKKVQETGSINQKLYYYQKNGINSEQNYHYIFEEYKPYNDYFNSFGEIKNKFTCGHCGADLLTITHNNKTCYSCGESLVFPLQTKCPDCKKEGVFKGYSVTTEIKEDHGSEYAGAIVGSAIGGIVGAAVGAELSKISHGTNYTKEKVIYPSRYKCDSCNIFWAFRLPPANVQTLQYIVSNKNKSIEVRKQALMDIGLNDPENSQEVKNVLLSFLQNDDAFIRTFASLAIAKFFRNGKENLSEFKNAILCTKDTVAFDLRLDFEIALKELCLQK